MCFIVYLCFYICNELFHYVAFNRLNIPLRVPSLNVSLTAVPFTPDFKLISFTNPFLHSHSYSFRTAFTDS